MESPEAKAEQPTSHARDVAYSYASLLRWPILPGHWLTFGGSCSCKDPECPTPGAHPLYDPPYDAAATVAFDWVREWWTTYPYATVLTSPRGFVGISVPAIWGLTAVNPGAGLENTPVIDGRGRLVFFATTEGIPVHGHQALAPLMRVTLRYNRARWASIGRRGFIPLPPSCHGSRFQYVWLTDPWQQNPESKAIEPRPLPSVLDVVRALVSSAVETYEPGLTDTDSVRLIRALIEPPKLPEQARQHTPVEAR